MILLSQKVFQSCQYEHTDTHDNEIHDDDTQQSEISVRDGSDIQFLMDIAVISAE